MAGNQTQLEIVIKAIDEASATLKRVSANANEANVAVAESSNSAGVSFGQLVGGIVSAQVAYQALYDTYSTVKDFFEGSIKAAVDASAVMAQVRVNVENAGLSYAQLGPQIDAVAEKNTALGFTDEDSQASLGRLILATGNYNQALRVNQLAMDLSRSKGIDLSTATTLLQQVMAGNTRVMKTYGISLDSATTSGQALDILQQKLQGSAAAFANTAAGHLATVRAQWDEIQRQVGEQLMPLFNELFSALESNLPTITGYIQGFTQGVMEAVQFVKDVADYAKRFWAILEDLAPELKLIEVVLKDMAEVLGIVLGRLKSVLDAQIKASEAQDQATKVAQMLADQQQKLADAYNAVHKEQITAADLAGNDAKSTQLLTEAKKDLATQNKTTGGTFDDISNRIQAADNQMEKHADAVAKLETEYDKLRQSALTDLADLQNEFVTKMKSIQDSIDQTTQSINDLTASYTRNRTDETASVAEKIVASEQRIADLQKQLAASTSDTERQRLSDELTAELKNYDSSSQFRQQHLAEIQEAERRAGETDLQRTIEDYTKKQSLEEQDYLKKLDSLQKKLKAEQDEQAQEILLTQEKVTKIGALIDTATAMFQSAAKQRQDMTVKEVQAEIAQYQALAAAISQVKSANLQSISTVSTIGVPSIPHFASGGIVSSPTVALIGEAGPEAVIPLSLLGGGAATGGVGGITININGGTYYGDRKSVADFANQIARLINQNLKLNNYS